MANKLKNTIGDDISLEAHYENMVSLYADTIYIPEDPEFLELQYAIFDLIPQDTRAIIARAAKSKFFSDRTEVPVTEWEAKNLIDPIKTRNHVRQLLLMEEGDQTDNFKRYMTQRFTSNTKDTVVFGNISIPLQSHLLRDLEVKFEIDVDDNCGRTSLTPAMMLSLEWAPGPAPTNVIGLRSKIPGDRFVKKGAMMIGFENYPVPEDFPVEISEYAFGEYYIIKPYGLGSFTYQGRSYREHPFFSPGDYQSQPQAEGTMILTGYGEIRVKKNPTVEIDNKGEVWEVIQGPRDGMYIPLRPRPGKPLTKNFIAQLHTQMTEKNFLMSVPNVNWKMKIVRSGECDGSISITSKRDTVVIDSCCRMIPERPYPVRLGSGHVSLPSATSHATFDQSGCWIVTTKEGISRTPNFPKKADQGQDAMCIGVKCVVLAQMEHAMLFKDGDKPWDCIGGGVELGESPLQALVREITEETGEAPMQQQFQYFGVSDHVEDGKVVYRSHMYVTSFAYFKPGQQWRKWEDVPVSERTPWITRYERDIRVLGGFSALAQFYQLADHPQRSAALQISAALVPYLAAINAEKRWAPAQDLALFIRMNSIVTVGEVRFLAMIYSYPYNVMMETYQSIKCEPPVMKRHIDKIVYNPSGGRGKSSNSSNSSNSSHSRTWDPETLDWVRYRGTSSIVSRPSRTREELLSMASRASTQKKKKYQEKKKL